ncbi:MAG: hypothetical protein RIR62_2871 [Pseudomonadota bacterium]|jgi:anti-anti-sigma regulatory factor
MPILQTGATITLTGELRHADAAGLQAAAQAALAEGDALIDATGAHALPFGLLQVLVSARLTARALDRNLQIFLPDGATQAEAARDAGLAA